jgi:hypothetical protein
MSRDTPHPTRTGRGILLEYDDPIPPLSGYFFQCNTDPALAYRNLPRVHPRFRPPPLPRSELTSDPDDDDVDNALGDGPVGNGSSSAPGSPRSGDGAHECFGPKIQGSVSAQPETNFAQSFHRYVYLALVVFELLLAGSLY